MKMEKTEMSHADIAKNYREAKNKAAQIKILADLNDVTPATIRKVLIQEGVLKDHVAEENKVAEPQKKEKKQPPMPEFVREILKQKAEEIEKSIYEMQKEYDLLLDYLDETEVH